MSARLASVVLLALVVGSAVAAPTASAGIRGSRVKTVKLKTATGTRRVEQVEKVG